MGASRYILTIRAAATSRKGTASRFARRAGAYRRGRGWKRCWSSTIGAGHGGCRVYCAGGGHCLRADEGSLGPVPCPARSRLPCYVWLPGCVPSAADATNRCGESIPLGQNRNLREFGGCLGCVPGGVHGAMGHGAAFQEIGAAAEVPLLRARSHVSQSFVAT